MSDRRVVPAPSSEPTYERLTNDERFDMRAKYRRIKLRHDSLFYGPMKGATCGCDYCEPIRDLLRCLDDLDAIARAEADRG